MLLSIILPIYNVSKYLNECLNSIVCSRRNDIEIILIDDGSTDSSGTICDQYVANDKRCKVIHKKNGGQSDARNIGLTIASSRYIFFVDSDDYLMPHAIDTLLNCIEENADADIIQFRYIKVWNKYVERYSESGSYELYNNEEAYKYYIQGEKFTRTAWDKIYKRTLFEEIQFPKGYIAEDYGTTYKVLNRAQNLLFYDKVLYCYRQRENSTMSRYEIQLILDEYELGKEFYMFSMQKYPQLTMLANSEHINLLLKTNYRILTHPNGKEKKAKEVYEKVELTLKRMKNMPCQIRTKIIQKIYFCCRPLFILLMKIKFNNFKKVRNE